jgi:hypothetical protein
MILVGMTTDDRVDRSPFRHADQYRVWVFQSTIEQNPVGANFDPQAHAFVSVTNSIGIALDFHSGSSSENLGSQG